MGAQEPRDRPIRRLVGAQEPRDHLVTAAFPPKSRWNQSSGMTMVRRAEGSKLKTSYRYPSVDNAIRRLMGAQEHRDHPARRFMGDRVTTS